MALQPAISMEDLARYWRSWPTEETAFSFAMMAAHQLGIVAGWEYYPATYGLFLRTMPPGTPMGDYKPVAAMQSWRSEKNTRKYLEFLYNHHRSPRLCALATVSYFRMPERRHSMQALVRLRQTYGPQFPIVVYPHHAACTIGGQCWDELVYPEWDDLTGDGGVVLVQPTADLLTRWNAQTPAMFWEAAKRYGFTGLCLSLEHIQMAWSSGWKVVINHFLRFTRVIRYRVGGGLEDMLTHVARVDRDIPVVVYGVRAGPFASREAYMEAAQEALLQVHEVWDHA